MKITDIIGTTLNEGSHSRAQQAATAIAMKKAGKKPKGVAEETDRTGKPLRQPQPAHKLIHNGRTVCFYGAHQLKDAEDDAAALERVEGGTAKVVPVMREQDHSSQSKKAKSDNPDVEILDQLEAEYQAKLRKFKSLGGSNYQYADREQNLTPFEREARDIHGQLNFLYQRINAAKKAADKSK